MSDASENHNKVLLSILKMSDSALTAVEIAAKAKNAYTPDEIKSRMYEMRDRVYQKGDKYGLKRHEDASQAAARIVREATTGLE